MKKTSKIFGAVALSAALAVGAAMPAFAEPVQDPDSDYGWRVDEGVNQLNNVDGEDENVTAGVGDAYTDINLRTVTDQINCALPLEMTVAAKTVGGKITCPSAEAYKIQNNVETGPLYVTKLVAELVNPEDTTNWTAADRTSLPADDTALSVLGGAVYGTVFMQLTADGDSAATILTEKDKTSVEKDLTWSVPAKSDAAGSLGLKLEGSSSPISGITTDTAAGAKLMKVTYTVSAMHPDNATKLASE